MTLVVFVLAVIAPLGLAYLVTRRAEVSLRAPVKEHPYVPSGAPTSAMQHISELSGAVDRSIPSDRVPPQVETLQKLAERARAAGSIRSAAGHFERAASLLSEFTPLDERVPDLLAHSQRGSLRWQPHLEEELAERFTSVRNAAAALDPDGLIDASSELEEYLAEFTGLKDGWYELREQAASAIYPKTAEEATGWLAHAFRNEFADPESPEVQLMWSQWDGLSDPVLLDRMTTWIATEIVQFNWRFDGACALSSTATPLATLLSKRFEKKLLVINDIGQRFPPGSEPARGARLVLVDSFVRTGETLHAAASTVQHRGAHVAGAVFVCEDDLLPTPPLIEELRVRGTCITLFYLSSLLKARREAQLKSA